MFEQTAARSNWRLESLQELLLGSRPAVWHGGTVMGVSPFCHNHLEVAAVH